MQLLSRIPAARVTPDVISLSSTISACGRSSQWQLALLLLAEMPRRHNIAPNVISYSAAISACEKGGEWTAALQLHADMSSAKILPDVICWNACISACEKGWVRK